MFTCRIFNDQIKMVDDIPLDGEMRMDAVWIVITRRLFRISNVIHLPRVHFHSLTR
jgi:hypothetical protein